MGNIDKIKSAIKGWRLGDYFRQFSIVAAGIIVTFWGSDKVTEHSRQKEVRAAMQLVAEELEYNRKELRNIKHLLDIDRNMSSLLIEHKMDISGIPADTLSKYDKLFNNMSELSYKTDALDVLKGSSLMQYISDKRLLQDVLQTYFELGRRKKDVSDYYAAKTDVIMKLAMSRNFKFALKTNNNLLNQISFLISNDQFVNFVIMVPGFLYWEEFDELDEIAELVRANEKEVKEIISCPKCDGKILEKKTKRGKIFYGCSNYPKCDFASWDKPIEEKCPNCNGTLTEKKDKIKCMNCDYERAN